MNNNVLEKGIPSKVIVPISREDIINLSSDLNKTRKLIDESLSEFNEFCVRLVNGNIFYFHNTMMNIITDSETLDEYIVFNYDAPLTWIVKLLNLIPSLEFKEGTNIEKITVEDDEIKAKIKKLRKVSSPLELQTKFPYLYEIYNQNKESITSLLAILSKMSNPKAYLEKINLPITKFNLFKKQADFRYFINATCNGALKILDSKSYIKDYVNRHPIDIKKFKEIDDEKVALYITHQYLNEAQASSNPSEALYYVASYFKENSNHKIDDQTKISCSLIPGDQSRSFTITPKSEYVKFKNFLVHHPELNFLDIDRHYFKKMNLAEVESFMQKYFKELNVNWIFLEPDDESITKDVLKVIKSGLKTKREPKEHDLLELYMEKKAFFDSSHPYLIIRGKNTFDGYAGYLYDNGIVVLEKFFENHKQTRVAVNEAIYVMNMENFLELSQRSKSNIIDNHLCNRYIHKGNWQEKVLKEINGDFVCDKDSSLNSFKDQIKE